MSARRAIREGDQLRQIVGIDFTDAQLEAITADWRQPQAIIAGAGSGKTTVMAARVVWLVGHEGIPPEQILGLTFTNKAASELAARIRANLAKLQSGEGQADEAGEPTVSTYHAFAGSLISEHGLRCGIEPDLRVAADATRFQRASAVIHAYPGRLDYVGTSMPNIVKDVLHLDGQLAEHLVTTDQLRDHDEALIRELQTTPVTRGGLTGTLQRGAIDAARKRIELSHLIDAYRQAKADDGVMDFSDQMSWGAQLAALDEVAADMRNRFTAVLLDEYQDTSVAQRDLLVWLFAGPAAEPVPAHQQRVQQSLQQPLQQHSHSVTAVGDPAQSIYGWRGASATNLVQFLDDFPALGAPSAPNMYSLAETRRCAPQIIDVANRVAAEYYATSDIVRPLRAADANPAGIITAGLHADITEEVAALVEQVQTCHREGTPWPEIGILVRTGAETREVVAALRQADVPVEVVGLSGLLWQPAVRDVISVLQLMHDVTANPAALRLLTGPRWRIGPRDLALLGQRAAHLVRAETAHPGGLQSRLEDAVAGVDPSEVVSLLDAIEDPGSTPFSAEATERFAEFATMLAQLRQHIGEPLTDLTRRVVGALNIDLELMSSGHDHEADNLAAFIDVVADYSQHDRYASLAGLLAYLQAETDHDDGLDVAQLGSTDAVQLLTAHKAKGLEWDVVFLPFVCDEVFPSRRSRPRWVTQGSEIPVSLRGDAAGLTDIGEWSSKGLEAYKAGCKAEGLMEEHRLAYVAFTRARHMLHISGHRWGRTQKTPRATSPYLSIVREWLAEHGREPFVWADEPGDDDINPLLAQSETTSWPAPIAGMDARARAAAEVRAWQLDGSTPGDVRFDDADPRGSSELAEIDAQLDVVLGDIEVEQHVVRLPGTLSATQMMALAEDEQEFARGLARPMPRRPSSAARFGTRFHAWVESHYGAQELFDPVDLPGRSELDIGDDSELADLTEKFAAGPFGQRDPVAVEAPFSLTLAGQQVIGRIDAVFGDASGYEVVDFKTNRRADADPMQLAIYRLAWAELTGLDPALVRAAFYYVRLDQVVYHDELPGRDELERQITEAWRANT